MSVKLKQSYRCVSFVFAACLFSAASASAQTAPTLGTAGAFSVLGGSTVTNTGSSVLIGDLGVNPGSAITGFPPGFVSSGATDAGGSTSLDGQNAATTAANAMLAQACTTNFGPGNVDLGGTTLTPGVYCFASSASITGTVTLNGNGNSAAVFIFRTVSTLVTASGASVSLTNGAQACNVFWRVGSSATLGTTTRMVGTIIAQASVTMNTGASLSGRAIAQTGAVTLDTNTVTRSTCTTTGTTPGGSCPTIVMSPATLVNGNQGVFSTQTIRAGNGAAGDTTYTFSLTGAGILPPGLTLTSAGVLSGTPIGNGTYDFIIRATDPNGCFGQTAYTMSNPAAVPTLPQVFVVLLASALLALGYVRVRQRARTN